jgi:hypothetical protein
MSAIPAKTALDALKLNCELNSILLYTVEAMFPLMPISTLDPLQMVVSDCIILKLQEGVCEFTFTNQIEKQKQKNILFLIKKLVLSILKKVAIS